MDKARSTYACYLVLSAYCLLVIMATKVNENEMYKRILNLAWELTSWRRLPSIVHATTYNRPWTVKSSIVRCPSHTWYFVACSKGIFMRRRRTDPLEIGRNKNEKQNKPIKPKRSPKISMNNKLTSSSKQVNRSANRINLKNGRNSTWVSLFACKLWRNWVSCILF